MFKFTIPLSLLIVVSVSAGRCICEESNEYTSSVVGNDILKTLRLDNLGLPEAYNQDFVQNTQSFVGQFVLNLARMREQKVDQRYVDEMENYQNGFVKKINKFGSLSDRSSFVVKITDYSNYLGSQTEKITRYTSSIRDKAMQYYFYNILLNLVSSRSFYSTSLNNVDCIYQTQGPTRGNPKPPKKPKKPKKHSSEGSGSDSDDRSDF